MDQQSASEKLGIYLKNVRRPRQRDTSGTKTFWGLTPSTIKHLKMLESAGVKQGEIINAAVDALLINLARTGKLGGDIKNRLLSMEQQGLLAHQAMGQALIDSDGHPRSRQLLQQYEKIRAYLADIEKNGVRPKKRGRPKKVVNGYSQ